MNIEMQIPVNILKEGNRFIAYTPVFDLSTSAPTLQKVKARFSEAVQLFVEDLVKMGTLDSVLSDLGWKKINKRWRAPVQIAHETEKIKIPA
jgi:predicted RNase H-like HicB family nuclease